MNHLLIRVCFSLLLLGALPIAARAEPPRLPPEVRALRDVAYVTGGHERQKLDLYLPPKPAGAPLAVWIHGGGWEAGNKNDCPALGLLGKGYAVASLNYRLTQHAVFPAQIEDCKAAIRWLRAHAPEYGYDANHIGAWGSSAGGHLVALLAVTGEGNEFAVGENLGTSSRLQAVIDWFGPTDFPRVENDSRLMTGPVGGMLTRLFGGPLAEKHALAERASPVHWVTKDAAPMLIMHGTEDPLVPLEQSQVLYEKLKAAGAEVQLEVVPGAGHGDGAFFTPDRIKLMVDFFERHLRPIPASASTQSAGASGAAR